MWVSFAGFGRSECSPALRSEPSSQDAQGGSQLPSHREENHQVHGVLYVRNPQKPPSNRKICSCSRTARYIPVSLSRRSPVVTLRSSQVYSMLANGLLCRNRAQGGPRDQLDFGRLYEAMSDERGRRPAASREKFRCLWEYFSRQETHEREVTFELVWRRERRSVSELLGSSDKPLCRVEFERVFIEDTGSGVLQVSMVKTWSNAVLTKL